MTQQTGIVIIGRNEGERLIASLQSLGEHVRCAVYVDSGSTDGSVEVARGMGAEVVGLDTTIPFTAARARNAGFDALMSAHPRTTFVQFIDGDCSLREGWLAEAAAFLENRRDVAIVCGRRRERYPERSFYNAMCDREWNGPTGEITECGGDFLASVDGFRSVGGFNPGLIAGEEPELCVRLREKGWKIWRLDHEMTWHDANITRFSQWWRRQMRAGHAFAEVSQLHRESASRIWQRPFLRSLVWGLAVPVAVVLLAALFSWQFLFLLLVYPANVAKIALRDNARSADSWRAAFYLVLAKFPEAVGALKYLARGLTGRRQTIIEYK